MDSGNKMPLGYIRDKRIDLENEEIRTNPDGMSIDEMVAEARRPAIMKAALQLQCPHDWVYMERTSPAPGPDEKHLDDGAPYWICSACLERK